MIISIMIINIIINKVMPGVGEGAEGTSMENGVIIGRGMPKGSSETVPIPERNRSKRASNGG